MSSGWKIEFDENALKELRKLDSQIAKKITTFLQRQILDRQDPYSVGHILKGNHSELWRYRTGDWRIICSIQDQTLTILVVRVGHRSKIYDD